MKPKLILTDLDGTLLDDNKRLSPANRAALERAARLGAQVVLATGRSYPALTQELRDLSFLRYFILMNGAKVWDRQTNQILYRAEIDLDTAFRVFDLIEPLDATVDCYQSDMGYMPRRYYDHLDYYVPDPVSNLTLRSIRRPVEDLRATVLANGTDIQKIQCYFPHLELRPQVMELLARKVPYLIQSISMPANLELNAPGATKGTALQALCQTLSIDASDAVAFGDGTNDLDMFRTAGIGVAMANAHPDALAAADQIAPANTEDGVAQVLSQWF